jgi:CHAD domain-containing protein
MGVDRRGRAKAEPGPLTWHRADGSKAGEAAAEGICTVKGRAALNESLERTRLRRRHAARFTAKMAREIEEFFFDRYTDRWAARGCHDAGLGADHGPVGRP